MEFTRVSVLCQVPGAETNMYFLSDNGCISKHDIMFKKSDAKDYKPYNFIYMKSLERQDNSDKKQISDS